MVPVGFPDLQSGEDPQAGEEVAAPLDRLQVAGDVEPGGHHPAFGVARGHHRVRGVQVPQRVRVHRPDRVVQVLGEGDRGQSERGGAGARALHRPVLRVPGPLAVDVGVGRQRHGRRSGVHYFGGSDRA